MNQTVEQYLRCYLNYLQTNWVQHLPIAEFALNNSVNASFFVQYSYHPRADQLSKPHSGEGFVPASDKFLQTLAEIHDLVKVELAKAHAAHQVQADCHPSSQTFAVGDQVWLLRKHIANTRPCAQTG